MALREKIKYGKLVAVDNSTGDILKEVVFPKVPTAGYYSGLSYTPISTISDVESGTSSKWSGLDVSSYKLRLIPCEPNDQNIISWVRVQIGDEIYLVCDRLMFHQVDSYWAIDKKYPYLGNVENINGIDYETVCVLDTTFGAILAGQEEDLPTPSSQDTTWGNQLGYEKFNGQHNQYWNWVDAKTFTLNSVGETAAYGGTTPEQSGGGIFSATKGLGIRPILKLIPFPIKISGEDENLGEKTSPFQYTYTVSKDYLNNDIESVVVTFDDNIIDSYAPKDDIFSKTINLEGLWNEIEYGKHTLTIKVSDSTSEHKRVITFKKVANRPGLLPEKPSMDDVADTIKNTSNYIDYLCSEGVEGIANIIHKII